MTTWNPEASGCDPYPKLEPPVGVSSRSGCGLPGAAACSCCRSCSCSCSCSWRLSCVSIAISLMASAWLLLSCAPTSSAPLVSIREETRRESTPACERERERGRGRGNERKEPAQSRTEHARRSPRSQDAVQRPGRSHSSVRRTREFRGLDEAAKGDRAAQCVPRSTPPRRHGWGWEPGAMRAAGSGARRGK